jgi:hypothetical protein
MLKVDPYDFLAVHNDFRLVTPSIQTGSTVTAFLVLLTQRLEGWQKKKEAKQSK